MVEFIFQALTKMGFTRLPHPTFRNIMFALCPLFMLSAVGTGYFSAEPLYAAEMSLGAKAFQQNCSGCHFSDSMSKKVGPGLQGLFKNSTLPATGRPVSDKAVRGTIANGGKQMPPFKHLKQEDVSAIIEYLKSL